MTKAVGLEVALMVMICSLASAQDVNGSAKTTGLTNPLAIRIMTFHDSSHGFRPHRGAHTAIAEAKTYVGDGYALPR